MINRKEDRRIFKIGGLAGWRAQPSLRDFLREIYYVYFYNLIQFIMYTESTIYLHTFKLCILS